MANQRVPIRELRCPSCQKKGTLRRRLMGMPGEDFDHNRFASGGCIVEGPGLDADMACRKCDWEGFRYHLDRSLVPDHLLAEEMLMGVAQNEFYNEDGELQYFWDVTDAGVHFEFESSGVPGTAFSMDMEIQFVVPKSEYGNLKDLFDIADDVDIEDAIEQLSGSERAEEFCDALNTTIKVVDRLVWMS